MTDRLLWSNMTEPEKITLPTYPTVAIAAGLLYAFQPPERLSGPAFDTARDLWSMDMWGAIFMLVGVTQVVALSLGRMHGSRPLYVATLFAGVALTGFWTVLLFLSAVGSPYVSYTSAVYVFALTVLQIASTRGLRRRYRA